MKSEMIFLGVREFELPPDLQKELDYLQLNAAAERGLRYAAYQRQLAPLTALRHQRQSNGLCARCGAPRDTGRSNWCCSSCLAGKHASDARTMIKRRLLGRCASCDDLARRGRVRCQRCADQETVSRR
jgi:hypothetical protein